MVTVNKEIAQVDETPSHGRKSSRIRPQEGVWPGSAVAVVLIVVVSGCASVPGSGTGDGLFPDSEVLHEVAERPLEEHAVPGGVLLLEYTRGGFHDRVAGFV